MNKSKKQPIPPKLKDQLWVKFFGNSITGACMCCGTLLKNTSFHAGHVIAEAKGGELTLNNLVPVCKSCNSSMGVMNLYEYKEIFYSFEELPGELSDNFLCKLANTIFIEKNKNSNISNKELLIKIKSAIGGLIDEKLEEL